MVGGRGAVVPLNAYSDAVADWTELSLLRKPHGSYAIVDASNGLAPTSSYKKVSVMIITKRSCTKVIYHSSVCIEMRTEKPAHFSVYLLSCTEAHSLCDKMPPIRL